MFNVLLTLLLLLAITINFSCSSSVCYGIKIGKEPFVSIARANLKASGERNVLLTL